MNMSAIEFFALHQASQSTHFPVKDQPKSGWPCVVVSAGAAGRKAAGTVALIQAELARWGVASAQGCSAEVLTGINPRTTGKVELDADGVYLTASVDGQLTEAFMDIDPCSAPEEIAMWFVEHLWQLHSA